MVTVATLFSLISESITHAIYQRVTTLLYPPLVITGAALKTPVIPYIIISNHSVYNELLSAISNSVLTENLK